MAKIAIDESVTLDRHPIRPLHVDTDKHFFGAFGKTETEISAKWIVRLCQEAGGWKPFTMEQMENFYQTTRQQSGFTFNRLLDQGYIIELDGRLFITHEFICKCFMASPSKTSILLKEEVPA